jgi:geranylgeranyl reductase
LHPNQEDNYEEISSQSCCHWRGPSGATAARHLALGGSNVILIEKNLTYDKPCGGGLFVRAFDAFDIPQSLITKYVETIEIISPDNEDASVDIQQDPLGVVHRQTFDAALRKMAEEAGVALLHAKAQTVATESEGVRIEARTNDGTPCVIHAEYLIAADGVHSPTRKQLLGEVPSRVLTYYADVEKQESESCQFWFGDDVSPRHYAWVFPHHRGINIGLIADDRQRMGQFFRRLFERASLQGEPPKPKGYFIPYWKPMTLYRDRVFYVGDSASLVLPFTYEGIYYALQSGRLAAQAILENDPDSYAKNWNELNLKKFKFLRLLQTIFLRNDWFARRMSRLYRHPKFQRAVIGYWSGSRKPAGFFMTFWKIIKALTVYRD